MSKYIMEECKITMSEEKKFKFNVALIDENDVVIENKSKNGIRNAIKEYIKIVNTDGIKMMEDVVNIIGLKPEDLGDTYDCYSTKDKMYQLCHKPKISSYDNTDEDDIEKRKELNKNGIASYLVSDNVYGKGALICSNIRENGAVWFGTLEFEDIVELLYKKFHHIGLMVFPDGQIKEYTFEMNPLAHVECEDSKTYKENEVIKIDAKNYYPLRETFFGFGMILWIQFDPEDDIDKNINWKITRLSGNQKVFGRVIVTFEIMRHNYLNEYIDAPKEIFDKIVNISGKELEDHTIKPFEPKKIDGMQVITNRYRILDEKTNELSKNCKCKNDIKEKYYCTECFDFAFCSNECLKKNHICSLKDKKPINIEIKQKLKDGVIK